MQNIPISYHGNKHTNVPAAIESTCRNYPLSVTKPLPILWGFPAPATECINAAVYTIWTVLSVVSLWAVWVSIWSAMKHALVVLCLTGLALQGKLYVVYGNQCTHRLFGDLTHAACALV